MSSKTAGQTVAEVHWIVSQIGNTVFKLKVCCVYIVKFVRVY